jgi:hypothetical protein
MSVADSSDRHRKRTRRCKEYRRHAPGGEGPDEYLIACWQEVISVSEKEVERLEAKLQGSEPMKAGRPVPTLSTLERLFDEVDECYAGFKKLRIQQKTAEIGSEEYLDQLGDIWVQLKTLELKAKHAAQGIEDFQDSLPDDEPEPETAAHGRQATSKQGRARRSR